MREQVIGYKDNCPVCGTSVQIPDQSYCDKCGWLFLFFSDGLTTKLKERQSEIEKIKRKNLKEEQRVNKEIGEVKAEQKKLQQRHISSNSEVLELKKSKNKILNNLKKIKKSPAFNGEFNELESKIIELELALNSLLENDEEIVKQTTPMIEFYAEYKNGLVELKVAKIIGTPKQALSDLTLAVGFSDTRINSILDAEVVVPTQRVNISLKDLLEKEKHLVPLAVHTRKQYRFHVISHLFSSTLMKFKIKHGV